MNFSPGGVGVSDCLTTVVVGVELGRPRPPPAVFQDWNRPEARTGAALGGRPLAPRLCIALRSFTQGQSAKAGPLIPERVVIRPLSAQLCPAVHTARVVLAAGPQGVFSRLEVRTGGIRLWGGGEERGGKLNRSRSSSFSAKAMGPPRTYVRAP